MGVGANTFTSGFEGPWTTKPAAWDNGYFKNLLVSQHGQPWWYDDRSTAHRLVVGAGLGVWGGRARGLGQWLLQKPGGDGA